MESAFLIVTLIVTPMITLTPNFFGTIHVLVVNQYDDNLLSILTEFLIVWALVTASVWILHG